jgi:hypothetical protein
MHPPPTAAKPWPTPGERALTAVDPIILQIVEGTLNLDRGGDRICHRAHRAQPR